MASFRKQVSKAPRRTLKQRRTDHGEVTALHGTLGLSLLARPTDEHAAPERGLLRDILALLEDILSMSVLDIVRGGPGRCAGVREDGHGRAGGWGDGGSGKKGGRSGRLLLRLGWRTGRCRAHSPFRKLSVDRVNSS